MNEAVCNKVQYATMLRVQCVVCYNVQYAVCISMQCASVCSVLCAGDPISPGVWKPESCSP